MVTFCEFIARTVMCIEQNNHCCDCVCDSKIDSHPCMFLVIGGHICGRVTIDSKVGWVPAISVVIAEVAWFMESDVLCKKWLLQVVKVNVMHYRKNRFLHQINTIVQFAISS